AGRADVERYTATWLYVRAVAPLIGLRIRQLRQHPFEIVSALWDVVRSELLLIDGGVLEADALHRGTVDRDGVQFAVVDAVSPRVRGNRCQVGICFDCVTTEVRRQVLAPGFGELGQVRRSVPAAREVDDVRQLVTGHERGELGWSVGEWDWVHPDSGPN